MEHGGSPVAHFRGESPALNDHKRRGASRSISPAPARKRSAMGSPSWSGAASHFRRNEDRTYGNYGQMAGYERVERGRDRHHNREYTQQEIREFERMQPRKQVITDFDTPANADDLPGIYGRSNPFSTDAHLRHDIGFDAGRNRHRGHGAQPAEDPYLGLGRDDADDVEMAARRKERRPRDLKERVYFARDRAAELMKRRRLLQRCREVEEAIAFGTVEGITLPEEAYFEKVEEAYELEKSFE
eukprot:GGOE01065208.1.p1 GENE.GGOE01065208.1~~GGOE01065208.1.p1  ORF type:complete len:243 (+),score=7.69 GGOE01065208.1:64-792(+)